MTLPILFPSEPTLAGTPRWETIVSPVRRELGGGRVLVTSPGGLAWLAKSYQRGGETVWEALGVWV